MRVIGQGFHFKKSYMSNVEQSGGLDQCAVIYNHHVALEPNGVAVQSKPDIWCWVATQNGDPDIISREISRDAYKMYY